jgi:outer membrane protein TolC
MKREQRASKLVALSNVSILRMAEKLISSIIFITVVATATAQNGYENILKEIEANSTTLNALREQMEVRKLINQTGIYLENPGVEFNYLWGSPSLIGNRTDVSVTQSFDFPSAYAYRKKIANLENTNVELSYQSERITLLLSVRKICIELIYYNALAKEYAVRLFNSERIAETYKAKLDKGETNIIEYNKAQLNLIAVQNEVARIETEQKSLLSELKRLNGDKEISFDADKYSGNILPADFNAWYVQAESKSPVLQYVSTQIEINEQQIKLNRVMGLPKFSAGYMSEKIVGEWYQGVSIGISIPLWENKNQVKQAKTQLKASEYALNDTKVQFCRNLQNLYLRASSLQQTVLKYKNALSVYNNETLLKKALDAGEISLLEYLLEIEYYYSVFNSMLESERDFEFSFAELSAIEL